MPTVEFATLIFQGTRFDQARMPLDALPELSAYRSLVLSVARALFQDENPKRIRVPKGFDAGFQLFLERVEDGHSVLDVISRTTHEAHLFGDVFDRARDVVEEGIRAASGGAPMPPILTRGVLPRFSLFGRSLLPTERIIVGRPQTTGGAIYDRGVREAILRLSKTSYEDNVDLVGEICEADKIKSDFEFITTDGVRIPVNPSPLVADAVRHMFYSNKVRLRGTGLMDPNGIIQRVIDIDDLEESESDESASPSGCPTPIAEQVESLAKLETGWLDETSEKYDTQHLERLARLLAAVVAAFELPTPYVYPAADGLVRAEWPSGDAEIIAKIDVAGSLVEVLVVKGIDSVTEESINLAETGGESRFGRVLADALTGRTAT